MKKKIMAIMYDFDKTLSPKNMQDFSFINELGLSCEEFWQEADELRIEEKMDQVLTYMFLMYKKSTELNRPITKEYLNKIGNDIKLFPGVKEWFKRINDYAKKYDIIVEHYIISSGLKEIIESSSIGHEFKNIFASEYLYDDNLIAIWPKNAINYTNKTQYLMRISKGTLDISDDFLINKKISVEDRRIEFKNMIYIGDGITDIPCMKLTKDGGGVSIAVYTDANYRNVLEMYNDERINYVAKANYCENSEIDFIVKKTIEKLAIDNELKNNNENLLQKI